jgi:acetate---CoA ligase (ADP-forming)
MAENRAMLRVFRQAGFGLRRRGALGELTVSLDITPTAAVLERIDERDHQAVVASLRALLTPTSVAVVGAVREPGNIGEQVLAELLVGDFRGVVTPVNASGSIVRSIRATRTVAELEEPPDLAVIATPSTELLDAAAEAANAGCKAVLVLGADPHEPSPARAYDRLLEIVRTAGLRMVGPNSLGLLNSDPAVSLQALASLSDPVAGRLAVCSQSGAIGLGLLGHAAARRLGISAFVSLGNRVDVSTNDLLEFWEEDDRTAAVMLYVETFGNPERFARVARRLSRRKPILAVKGHRTTEARPREARSHTAAALRGDAAVDALLRHAGVMRFRGGEELFNAAEFFESQPLPQGRRIGIVTNSTGVATLAADACATRGLLVGEVGQLLEGFGGAEEPGEDTEEPGGDTEEPDGGTEEPAGGRSGNPMVLGHGASPEDYRAAIRDLLLDSGVDAIMGFYVAASGGEPKQVLETILDASTGMGKPVVASIVGADGRLPDWTGGVPNFLFPEACAAVLARGVERREWLSRPVGQVKEFDSLDASAARALVAAQLLERGEAGGWLATDVAEQLLVTHGLPVIPSRPRASVEGAVAFAGELGGPIALKADFEPPPMPVISTRCCWAARASRRSGPVGVSWSGACARQGVRGKARDSSR